MKVICWQHFYPFCRYSKCMHCGAGLMCHGSNLGGRDLDTLVSWHSRVPHTCVICLDLIAFCSSSMMATHLSLSVSFSVRIIMSMLTLEQLTEEQDTCNQGGKACVAHFYNYWKGQKIHPSTLSSTDNH